MIKELDLPPTMTVNEKLERLQKATGANSFAKFADMIGVNVQTLRRVGNRGEGSDRIFKRIAGKFQGLTTEMLLNPEKDIPENLILKQKERLDSETGVPTEGEQLRRYLENKHIRAARLAELMGVSRTQVHHYIKTNKFEAPTRDAILSALKVPASAVFADNSLFGLNNSRPAVKLVSVMTIRPKDRQIEREQLEIEMGTFSPAVMPDRSFYINPDLLDARPGDLAKSVAIMITQGDRLAPTFQPGAIVLARQVDRPDWWNVASSSVALLISGKLQVRRLLRNDLRGSGSLEVGSFDVEQGSAQLISLDDIQAMFCITHILLSPA